MSNHIGTGALIGAAISNPVIAVPVALISHFVLDALPHFGYKADGGYTKLFSHKLGRRVTAVDIVIVLGFGMTLAQINPWLLIVGLVALSPDVMWPIRYLRYERKGLKPVPGWITHFHWHIQKYERPWGLGVEIVYLTVVMTTVVSLLPN